MSDLVFFQEPNEQESAEQANRGFYEQLYGSRTYRYDAISGAQIKVKLQNDVLIEDITAIQYTLTQSKKPVYGYHSQYFDAVAPGVVIVHGRLWMNFIHQGYLRILIESSLKGADFLAEFEKKAEEANKTSTEDIISWIKANNKETLNQLTASDMIQERPDLKSPIDIHIEYGDITQFKAAPIKRIYDVQFIGEGQDSQISGQPLQEWYEFIARRVT